MMRWSVLVLTILFTSCAEDEPVSPALPDPALPGLDGPVDRPTEGYGKDGSHQVARITFPSPGFSGREVEIFHPEDQSGPLPTLFFSHPYGGTKSDDNHGLFEFVARKGYVIIYAPYQTDNMNDLTRYTTLWVSFKKAVTDYPDIIDSGKVGFVGHSYGGGATFSMAYKGFVEEGWGENGRLIFSMAPWYALNITEEQLQSFPDNTSLIMEVYENDQINDHRLAADLFDHINIPLDEKDFITVKESVFSDYTYTAGHNMPDTQEAYDANDYYAVYRLLDALMDYRFNGNSSGKKVALGNGSAEQITMPCTSEECMTNLEVSDFPIPQKPQSNYQFPCNSTTNARVEYCE